MKIYVASKAKHAPMWRSYRDVHKHPIVAAWIDRAGEGEITDWPAHWEECIHQASTADALLAYHVAGETPKGALIEIGAALANDVPVFAIGFGKEYSFLWHPRVEICSRFQQAFELMETLRDDVTLQTYQDGTRDGV